ncbi:MAG: hypothetical protein NC489_38225 [Ruminococcus flavefaciens]|nr:hypothetical protein [Ruminococcus flavefaciens]
MNCKAGSCRQRKEAQQNENCFQLSAQRIESKFHSKHLLQKLSALAKTRSGFCQCALRVFERGFGGKLFAKSFPPIFHPTWRLEMGADNFFSNLFGGGAADMPETPVYESSPQREREGDPEEAAARDAERKKNRARAGGVRSTLLTNPLGGSGSAANPSGLLGGSS